MMKKAKWVRHNLSGPPNHDISDINFFVFDELLIFPAEKEFSFPEEEQKWVRNTLNVLNQKK